MKSFRFIILLGVFVSILIAGCASFSKNKSQAQWQVVVPKTLFAEKLRFAAFLNDNFGLNGGAGDIGKARFTMDGGKTWIQAESSGG